MSHVAITSSYAPRGIIFKNTLGKTFARFDVARQRRKLRSLDDAALRDLGLTYKQAVREARKPFFL